MAETTATIANISEPRPQPLAESDNRIIHGLWLGQKLPLLQQLTLRSSTHHGHSFSLWVYDELDARLPVGVSLCDASLVLPRERLRELLSHIADRDRIARAKPVLGYAAAVYKRAPGTIVVGNGRGVLTNMDLAMDP